MSILPLEAKDFIRNRELAQGPKSPPLKRGAIIIMTENHRRTLLVTGASGHLGQRVIELLLESNTDYVIAATRTPEKLAHLAERGVEVRKADFDDPSSLTSAFAGVDRLLLISTDTLDGTDRQIVQHRNAVIAANQAGVKLVVYTSLFNPAPDSPIAIAPDHYATEQALSAISLNWTVLRNNVYTDYQLPSLARGGNWAACVCRWHWRSWQCHT